MTSRGSDASFRAGRLSNHVSEGFFVQLLYGKLTFHTHSLLKQEKRENQKSQVEWEARHPVSPLQVVSPGHLHGAFNWAPGAGDCKVCACSASK